MYNIMKIKALLPTAAIIIAAVTLSSCEKDDDDAINGNGNQHPTDSTLSGTYDEDLHLENLHDDPSVADYTVTGHVTINAKLTIDPGVRIEFEEDQGLRISSSAIFEANGTEEKPIVFTTADLAGGKYWEGIRVRSSDIRNKMVHVVVEYAGNSNMSLGPYSSQNRQTNVGINDDATLSIHHSHIRFGKGYGLFVRGTILDHEENTYTDNMQSALSAHVRNAEVIDELTTYSGNGFDGPEIYGGTIESQMTWSKIEGDTPFKISGDIDVEAPLYITEGVTLMLDEDIQIVVDEGSGGSVIDGYIDVQGTSSMPVTFTTSNLAGGQHWKGIRIKTSDMRNQMEHVVIEYAGNSNISIGPYSSQNRQANIAVDSHAHFTLKNAMVRQSKGWGIAAIANATLTLENVQYENNAEGNLSDGI